MKIYVLILALAVLSACSSKKETVKNNQTKEEVKKDSISKKEVNKAIDNTYQIPLRSGNKEVDEKIARALENFRAGANSGSNSTNITFDKELMSLLVQSKIGETSSEKTETSNEKTFEQKQDEYFRHKIRALPWYIWFLLVVLGLVLCLSIYTQLQTPILKIIGLFKRKKE